MTFQSQAGKRTVIVLLGLLLALSIGFAYATGNQHTYLVAGLRAIDPEFLQYDWFATQTTHYHGNFVWLIRLLAWFGPLPLTTVVLNVALIIASVWALFRLLDYFDSTLAIPMLTLLVTLMILGQSTSVGQSYIYSAYLQPSSVASVFWLLAMVWLVLGRYWLSGGFLLISGVMHTNFLLLGIAAVGLTHLLMGRQTLIVRGLANLLPSLLYLLYLLPGLLAMSESENGALSRHIYQYIRSPHHYVPMTYLPDFVKFFGFCLLGFGFWRPEEQSHSRLRPLLLLFASMTLLVVVATLLTTVVYIPVVSALFPWRLAPFCELAVEIVLVYVAVKQLYAEKVLSRQAMLVLGSGASLVLTYYLSNAGLTYWLSLPVSIFICFLGWFFWRAYGDTLLRLNRFAPQLLGVALLCAVVLRLPGGYFKSNLLHPADSARQALFEWVREKTPPQAQFLIPPNFADFRLSAARAVVVDWKSPPIMPDEVITWYRRINDIAGQEVHSAQEANRGYAQMDAHRLNTLKTKYAPDYAVFYRKNDVLSRSLGQVVFSNEKYVVIRLQALSAAFGAQQ